MKTTTPSLLIWALTPRDGADEAAAGDNTAALVRALQAAVQRREEGGGDETMREGDPAGREADTA